MCTDQSLPGRSRICVRNTQWYSAVEMTHSAQGPLASSSSIFLQVLRPYLHIVTQSLVDVAIMMPSQPRQLIRKPVSWRHEFAMAQKNPKQTKLCVRTRKHKNLKSRVNKKKIYIKE